jgi:ubiquinone/menaquinone biosynthesis C-methylase UbiE
MISRLAVFSLAAALIRATLTSSFSPSIVGSLSSAPSSSSSCRRNRRLFSSAPAQSTSAKAPPRTGIAQRILNFALESPLWKLLLVPQAKAKIVTTAEANGIPWVECKQWIQSNMKNTTNIEVVNNDVPSYYQKAFHAYEEGNLSWDAAWEVEIASAAVGARNFPQYGCNGEDAFRGAFSSALIDGGAVVPDNAMIVDLGCGSGMSTRRLAQSFPQAKSILGIDLSPYYIEVGKRLLELQPKSFQEGGTWVSSIVPDNRIEYRVGNAAKTALPDSSVDVVNLQFVLHELPANIALEIVDEALRILKPNGQLWICEMDFEAPAYAAQRANALLFSLIRSTEPYLDDYAESISDLFQYIESKYSSTTVIPATGRHYALVATKGIANVNGEKGIMNDQRFNDDGTYKVEDTHLQVWEESR